MLGDLGLWERGRYGAQVGRRWVKLFQWVGMGLGIEFELIFVHLGGFFGFCRSLADC